MKLGFQDGTNILVLDDIPVLENPKHPRGSPGPYGHNPKVRNSLLYSL